MNVVVLYSSPNEDGLTAACAAAAVEGIQQGGGNADEVRLNDLKISSCQACGEGWGACRTEHECELRDDFQALHQQVIRADALILVNPVYWGEMSESAKAFTDRLRRSEATREPKSQLAGKPVIAVAAAGGTGNGTITCLGSMERWIQHTQGRVFDLIAVNRWTREYKLETIRAAAQALASEVKA